MSDKIEVDERVCTVVGKIVSIALDTMFEPDKRQDEVKMLLSQLRIKERDINERKLPAIPPDDYTGTMADWNIACIERGIAPLYDEIGKSVYEEILLECEGEAE